MAEPAELHRRARFKRPSRRATQPAASSSTPSFSSANYRSKAAKCEPSATDTKSMPCSRSVSFTSANQPHSGSGGSSSRPAPRCTHGLPKPRPPPSPHGSPHPHVPDHPDSRANCLNPETVDAPPRNITRPSHATPTPFRVTLARAIPPRHPEPAQSGELPPGNYAGRPARPVQTMPSMRNPGPD